MYPREYHKPTTLEQAWELQAAIRGARYVGGGTDLMVKIRRGDLRPDALISLRGIADLRGLDLDADPLRIGAMTTIAELESDPAVARRLPALHQAARVLGSRQIRNVATIGGNLSNASPCADTAPPLLALAALVVIAGPDGERELPVERVFRGPGGTCLEPRQLVREIRIDPPAPGARGVFLKKGRVRMDLGLASVAAVVELDGETCTRARLAAGSVAPTPIRLRRVEQLVEGRRLTAELLAEARRLAFDEVAPITDIRATEDYRRQIVGVYVERALARLLQEARS